jgi:hypothetical protein
LPFFAIVIPITGEIELAVMVITIETSIIILTAAALGGLLSFPYLITIVQIPPLAQTF